MFKHGNNWCSIGGTLSQRNMGCFVKLECSAYALIIHLFYSYSVLCLDRLFATLTVV